MQTQDDVEAFRKLHDQQHVLALPNAWDAASAALLRAAGVQAIATTSAGVAWAAGFADGNFIPKEEALAAVGAICRVSAGLPVTVDIESGYSDDPSQVAELAVVLRVLGAAGINIEDGTGKPELLAAKISAIKQTARERGTSIFINARVDVLLHNLASGDAAIEESISRAQQYAQGGADGIFVPLLSDPGAIRAVARATSLPLNILAIPGLPGKRELYNLGVRRLSAGSALAKVALGAARQAAAAFLGEDGIEALFPKNAVASNDMNALFPAVATK